MAMNFDLQGKVVVLTGAAGGIGRGLSAAFVAQGCTLIAVDRSAGALAALREALPGIQPWQADLGDDVAVQALADGLGLGHGRVDVLIHNAGVEYPTPVAAPDAQTVARWAALMDNNVVSMVRLTRALLPWMPAGASIIHQASIWGHTGVGEFSAYSASKHAVIGLTRSLAWELAPRHIRVNAVCPGWVRTDAAWRSLQKMAADAGVDEATMERQVLARQAQPRWLLAEDLAGTFLFLASAAADALTGQSLSVSHGEVML